MLGEEQGSMTEMRWRAQRRSVMNARPLVCLTCGITKAAAQRVADQIDLYCDGPIGFESSAPICLAFRLKQGQAK